MKMAFERSKQYGVVLAVMFAVVMILLSPPGNAGSIGINGEENETVFLPFISYEISTIYGQVTFGNLGPWPDVKLDLRFFNGAEWSTTATTTTDSDGIYIFTNVPSLLPGQRYYVRYLNTEAEGSLYTWHTKPITSFQAGQQVHGGDFSIAGINLNSPPAGSPTSIPANFRWSLRNGHTSDSYELNLFEPQTGSPYFYTNPSLGFVDSYTLNNLPAGFNQNTWYVWNIWVYGENGNAEGNWGISFWSYYVSFYGSSNSEQDVLPKIRSAEIISSLVNSGQLADDLDLGK
ncbi:MAG: hypothetical protein IPM53_02005 [Anaerolineaceae bacterium]|nr:hypothetical protein [Anaerolineaceae bacterium]